MALKSTITVDEYEALDGLKAAYKVDGDNYVLDMEPVRSASSVDELGEIKRALARERVERKELKQQLDELSVSSSDDDKKKALKAQDIEKLTKAHDSDLKKRDEKLSSRDRFIKRELIDAKVQSVSKSLAGDNSKALDPHVRKRLSVDFSGDNPQLQVLDKDGNPGSTIEDLEKELLDTDYLASILVGSKATGSGATGNQGAGGAGTGKKFDEHTSSELVALRKSNPKQYEALRAARDS